MVRLTPRSVATVSLALLVSMLPGCADRTDGSLVVVDTPVLVTSDPPPEGGFTFDSAWGGTVDETEGCVTVADGDILSVLVAPHDSIVVTDPDTAELFLRVEGADYEFGETYTGGGYIIEGSEVADAEFAGADECIAATGADSLMVIYSIDPDA